MSTIQNVLRAAPCIILASTVLVWLVSGNLLYARFAGYVILTELITKLLKQMLLPLKTVRPAGAGNCKGCECFVEASQECINVDDQPGMPSGHTTVSVMAATFWSLYIFRRGRGSRYGKLFRSIALVSLATAVVISRTAIMENCHTIPQVVAGSVLGIALGIGFYSIEEKMQSSQ